MKLVSVIYEGKEQLGFLLGSRVFMFTSLSMGMPQTMLQALDGWDKFFPDMQRLVREVEHTAVKNDSGIQLSDLKLLAPLPNPPSLRDGYAFRQHVETARKNRGLEMTPVFDSYPVFYFGNPRTVFGPGPVNCMPDHFKKLDFELEAAIIINRRGKNIRAGDADEYIAGLMILNDFSARTLQMEEMLLNLGPAKGKDFASTTGPWLVTTDELKSLETSAKNNHTGKSWNLIMKAKVNGQVVSQGNLSDMDWTFAELIERASYGAELLPGDIIGSGTVGTGCFLELNGTGKLSNPDYTEKWLKNGDDVELTIEGLGKLTNQIFEEQESWSILNLKK